MRVVSEYERELGRRPTRTEWQHLLHDTLEPDEHDESSETRHMLNENARPQSVLITLEGG